MSQTKNTHRETRLKALPIPQQQPPVWINNRNLIAEFYWLLLLDIQRPFSHSQWLIKCDGPMLNAYILRGHYLSQPCWCHERWKVGDTQIDAPTTIQNLTRQPFNPGLHEKSLLNQTMYTV